MEFTFDELCMTKIATSKDAIIKFCGFNGISRAIDFFKILIDILVLIFHAASNLSKIVMIMQPS